MNADLSRGHVDVAGGQDILADPEDTVILLRHLPKVLAHHHEPKYGESQST